MTCPRCNSPFQQETLRDSNISIEVDKCVNCEGIWFDRNELSKADAVAEPKLVEIRHIPGQKAQLKALLCPKCENHPFMKKAEHPRDEKVILDYCEQCGGIWLDKGELKAIQQESWLTTLGRIIKWLAGKD